MNHDKFLQPLQ